ncbi:cytochrome P450 4F6 isoform X2 [Sesbania bispinosa]|nr:cytochrome P450 4F6 isoform X2 [Sesbania bispinosa]
METFIENPHPPGSAWTPYHFPLNSNHHRNPSFLFHERHHYQPSHTLINGPEYPHRMQHKTQ